MRFRLWIVRRWLQSLGLVSRFHSTFSTFLLLCIYSGFAWPFREGDKSVGKNDSQEWSDYLSTLTHVHTIHDSHRCQSSFQLWLKFNSGNPIYGYIMVMPLNPMTGISTYFCRILVGYSWIWNKYLKSKSRMLQKPLSGERADAQMHP